MRDRELCCSVGVVRKVMRDDNGMAKYLISFNDDRGRKHLFWCDWSQPPYRDLGNSIPIKFVYLPYTLHRKLVVVEVDGAPQYNDRIRSLMYGTLTTICIGASVFAGYVLGRTLHKS